MARCSTPQPIYKSSRKSHSNKRATLVTGKWYNRKRLVHYKSPFKLLDLPSPVTAQIWRECVTADSPVKICVPPFPEQAVFFRNRYTEPSHIRMLRDPVGIDLNVLFVCRRIWDEAKLAIYQANTLDYGFLHYNANMDRWSRKYHEYIPERTRREEIEKWRHNDFFSLAGDDSPGNLATKNSFIVLPSHKVTAIRSLSISSPTARFDLCASFEKLRHVTISYPGRFAFREYNVCGLGPPTTATRRPPSTFSFSEYIPDEEDATLPKFFESIEDISEEDMKRWVSENREAEQEFHKLLGLWKAAVPEMIKLWVSFSISELKEGRETQIVVPLEEVIDPEYVATRDRNRVRLNLAWLEPVGTWRCGY